MTHRLRKLDPQTHPFPTTQLPNQIQHSRSPGVQACQLEGPNAISFCPTVRGRALNGWHGFLRQKQERSSRSSCTVILSRAFHEPQSMAKWERRGSVQEKTANVQFRKEPLSWREKYCPYRASRPSTNSNMTLNL